MSGKMNRGGDGKGKKDRKINARDEQKTDEKKEEHRGNCRQGKCKQGEQRNVPNRGEILHIFVLNRKKKLEVFRGQGDEKEENAASRANYVSVHRDV